MKTLIVYTHPTRDSLNGAFLEKTLEGLSLNPAEVDVKVLDLYEIHFDPALIFNPEKRRRDMHQDPEMQTYRDLVLWSELIVFIYPIWWGRPPAMLLGFFDRLMASGFAYRDIDGSPLPEGLLKGRSVVCVSTMKGPTGYLQYWLYNSHRVLMKKAVFNFVGIRRVRFLEIGGMEAADGRQSRALERVKAYFSRQRFRTAIPIPRGIAHGIAGG